MGADSIPTSKAERVWRAVLAEIAADPTYKHDACDVHDPMDCPLFRAIADALGGGE